MVDGNEVQQRSSKAGALAKDFARSQLKELKERGPFFQAKVALVAAYAVVVLLTLALTPPGHPSWVAAQTRLSFGLSFKTAVELTNVDNGDLDDVVVVVTGKGIEFDGRETAGTWQTRPLDLPEGTTLKIVAEQLFDDRNVSPPYSLVVSSVRVLRRNKTLVELPVPPASTP